jgi:hypothetical protein
VLHYEYDGNLVAKARMWFANGFQSIIVEDPESNKCALSLSPLLNTRKTFYNCSLQNRDDSRSAEARRNHRFNQKAICDSRNEG